MAKRRCGCKGARRAKRTGRKTMKGKGGPKKSKYSSTVISPSISGRGAGGIFKKVRKPVKFLARVLKNNASDPDVKKAATVMGSLASNKKRKQSKGAEAALTEAIVRAGI